jgi:hypothetical protein
MRDDGKTIEPAIQCYKLHLIVCLQPAKRRPPEPAETSTAPKTRQSKLAKEHNISGAEENEIKEAFALFSEPHEGEKVGVIPISDVRRAMMYSSQPPRPLTLHIFHTCNTMNYR